VDPDAVAALRTLAHAGALAGAVHVTCSELAERLDASAQTASRRLQGLEEAGLIERSVGGNGGRVRVTDDGEWALRREYEAYRRLFADAGVSLTGAVTDGMGEGRHYITLPGYAEQFREKLGYEPFPGTLNLTLDAPSVRRRSGLEALDPIPIDGWEGEDRTYGPAACYPATVARCADAPDAGGARTADAYEEAHVIDPERTHHDADSLELIAPDRLRDVLGLNDGDRVEVHVREP
jgi:riboflavin kinase